MVDCMVKIKSLPRYETYIDLKSYMDEYRLEENKSELSNITYRRFVNNPKAFAKKDLYDIIIHSKKPVIVLPRCVGYVAIASVILAENMVSDPDVYKSTAKDVVDYISDELIIIHNNQVCHVKQKLKELTEYVCTKYETEIIDFLNSMLK